MKRLLPLLLIFPLFFVTCISERIGFIETNPSVPYLNPKMDMPLTFSFRSAVEDSFLLQSKGAGKTMITDFKKTLTVAFRNTFSGSFNTLSWYNNFSLEGYSIVIASMKMEWYNKSESSSETEIGARVSYRIVLYKNGEWLREIEKQNTSRTFLIISTPKKINISNKTPVMVLRSAIESACEDIYRTVMPDFIESSASRSGTGFLISQQGYVITNAHVIESARTINVKGINGDFKTKTPATLIAKDNSNDLALLKIDFVKPDSLPFSLRLKGLEIGESVFILGFPLIQHMGEEIKLTSGIISSKSGYQSNSSSYQVSAIIQPGNSGSPVFDVNGNLIGVANAKLMGTEGVTYVIKPSYIRTLFDNAEIELNLPQKSQIEGRLLPEQAKALSPLVYIIEVED